MFLRNKTSAIQPKQAARNYKRTLLSRLFHSCKQHYLSPSVHCSSSLRSPNWGRTHRAGSSFYGAGGQAGHNWQPITGGSWKRLKSPAHSESPDLPKVSAEVFLVQKIHHFSGCSCFSRNTGPWKLCSRIGMAKKNTLVKNIKSCILPTLWEGGDMQRRMRAGKGWQMAAELGGKRSTNKFCQPRASGVLLRSGWSQVWQNFWLYLTAGKYREEVGKKSTAEWISYCLKEKFNERSKMKLEEELEKKHTSRCFAVSKIQVLLCSSVPTPSRALQWLHSLSSLHSVKMRNHY